MKTPAQVGEGFACAGFSLTAMRVRYMLILAAVALTGVLAWAPVHVLLFSTGDDIVLCRRVHPGDSFQLGYLHSVEKSDVWERFRIDPQHNIVLTETMFQGQAAGLPSSLSHGERLTREGKWFKISGMNRVLPHLYWRVQARWCDRVRFNDGDEVDLSSRVGDTLILIHVQKMHGATWVICTIRKALQKAGAL